MPVNFLPLNLEFLMSLNLEVIFCEAAAWWSFVIWNSIAREFQTTLNKLITLRKFSVKMYNSLADFR